MQTSMQRDDASEPGPAPVAASSEPVSDAQIIARVQAGELPAFALLMRRYNRLVFRCARSVARSDAEAEDVAQEAWLTAYQHLAQFEGRAAFSTWVSRIAIRMAGARTRRDRKHAPLDALERAAMPDEVGDNPALELERRQMVTLLERAIDALPADYRLVIMLRDVEQMSTEEAAQTLGLSEENVRVRLHRSRAALRELMTKEVGGVLGDAFAFDGQRCTRIVDAVLAQLSRAR